MPLDAPVTNAQSPQRCLRLPRRRPERLASLLMRSGPFVDARDTAASSGDQDASFGLATARSRLAPSVEAGQERLEVEVELTVIVGRLLSDADDLAQVGERLTSSLDSL
jgi:hypothetical protein